MIFIIVCHGRFPLNNEIAEQLCVFTLFRACNAL